MMDETSCTLSSRTTPILLSLYLQSFIESAFPDVCLRICELLSSNHRSAREHGRQLRRQSFQLLTDDVQLGAMKDGADAA